LGDIVGVNMKDTKLISKAVSFITEQGNVNVRKLRNDDCTIKSQNGSIKIGSYLESGELKITT
jgi:hypothetical protein